MRQQRSHRQREAQHLAAEILLFSYWYRVHLAAGAIVSQAVRLSKQFDKMAGHLPGAH